MNNSLCEYLSEIRMIQKCEINYNLSIPCSSAISIRGQRKEVSTCQAKRIRQELDMSSLTVRIYLQVDGS